MRKIKPLVSVCCITYNQDSFLRETLQGFEKQEVDFPIEIIIYDDFSSDSTREILTEYKNRSKFPIVLLLSEENRYSKGDRIFPKTFAKARGSYLALCEGDDYWTDPHKLQKQVHFLKKNEDYNLCFHNIEIYNNDSKELKEDTLTRKVPDTTRLIDLARGNYIHTPSVMLRNNFIIPNWFRDVKVGDWSLYMIQVKDKKIKKLSETMAVYRVRQGAMWSTQNFSKKKKNTRLTIEIVAANAKIPLEVKNILKGKLAGKKKKATLKYRIVNRLKKTLKLLNKSK